MNREVLCRPFEPSQIKQRQGAHGKTISYVDVSTVLARLHAACDVVTFEVLRHEVLENEVVVVGRLTADGTVNIDFGCSAITRDGEGFPVSVGDDLKAASSDSLKRCARLLGCPLDLQTQAERGNAAANGRAPTAPAERLTSRQLAAIQAACRRRNVGRDELHALVSKLTGKSAVQFLTKAEASAVLDELGQPNGAAAH